MATDNKYDRQLRLWGADAQRRLSEAHALLLKAGPTGTETLKNLVLPGIGKFTIVDDKKVSKGDTANNFFLTEEFLGQSRSEVACNLLGELNSDVQGSFVEQNPLEFCRSNDLTKFNLVIVTELVEEEIVEIENMLHNLDIPLVVARTMGYIGMLRISTKIHCIIESKPSPAPAEDLRLADPFPELEQFVNTVDLSKMDSKEHSHVPYGILLVKLAKDWKDNHNGQHPSSRAEKNEFRESIKKASKRSWGEEENFLEAFENAYLAYGPRGVPDQVTELLNQELIEKGASASRDEFNKNFWVMVEALGGFIQNEGNGKLPVAGKVPDMTSSTELFIELQKIYQKRAQSDAEAVHKRVQAILTKQNRPSDSISLEQVELFCKNAAGICMVQVNPISSETDLSKITQESKDNMEMLVMEGVGDSSPMSPLLFYFMFRAVDKFYSQHKRFPGANGKLTLDSSDTDSSQLLPFAQQLVGELQLNSPLNITSQHADEMTRYGGVELHNISAVIGGIASQECVKLLTHQFTLLNNTYIYNGISGEGLVLAL